MKLLDRRNRLINGTEYRRWYIDIPARYIEQVGWKKGQRLRAKVVKDTLVFSLDDEEITDK